MNFNQASDFVRLVEEARPKYRRYCAVCGCENIRWAGCIDPFHDQPKSLIEHPFPASLGTDIDDPGTACDGNRGRAETPVEEASPHE